MEGLYEDERDVNLLPCPFCGCAPNFITAYPFHPFGNGINCSNEDCWFSRMIVPEERWQKRKSPPTKDKDASGDQTLTNPNQIPEQS